jgi:hypothetical protein
VFLIIVIGLYLPQYGALHCEQFLAAGFPQATQTGGPSTSASSVSRSYVSFKLWTEIPSNMALILCTSQLHSFKAAILERCDAWCLTNKCIAKHGFKEHRKLVTALFLYNFFCA